MRSAYADSGLDCIGPIPWGTHFCQFYETAQDLKDTVVPYFKAGLDANEGCLWVASTTLGVDGATDALRAAVPDLDARIKRGQMEIVNNRDFFPAHGAFDAERVLGDWSAKTQSVLAKGYAGVRVAGAAFWIAAPCAFENFTDFERRLSQAIAGQPIVCLCSYCLAKTQATDVLDVVRHHEFALARREGAWEVVESAALKVAKSRLLRANEDLERKVSDRTAHLREALADKEVLLREVHHRVNNNLQVISSLMLLKSKELAAAGARHVLDDVLRRINAISLVHETLYLEEDSRGIDVSAYLADLARTLVASYGLEEQVRVGVSTQGGFLGLTEAVPVSLIATEVITHALRHRRADASASALDIAYAEEDAGSVLTIRDTIAPRCEGGQPHTGLAVALVDKLAAQVDGRVAYERDGDANVFTLRFPPA